MRLQVFCRLVVSLGVALVAACSHAPQKVEQDGAPRKAEPITAERVIPKAEPKSRYGNPQSYVVLGKRYYVMDTASGYVERGIASWYGTKFHGRRTSSGETYNMYALTAAHKTLPLPTYARITNLQNGRSIIVKINDRGPFHSNRLIDLSYGAAVKLGIVSHGTGLVEVRVLEPQNSARLADAGDTEIIDVADTSVTAVSTQAAPVTRENIADKELNIFIQVGAFRTVENATRMRAQLAALNLGKVTVFTSDLGGTPIHRVRIGPVSTVEETDRIVNQLESAGHYQHDVVIE